MTEFYSGIGHWVAPAAMGSGRFMSQGDEGPPVHALQEMLERYGYGVPQTGQYCARTRDAVVAFQRHFRPQREKLEERGKLKAQPLEHSLSESARGMPESLRPHGALIEAGSPAAAQGPA